MIGFHKSTYTFFLCAGLLVVPLKINSTNAVAGTCTEPTAGAYICSGAAGTDSTQNLWEFTGPIAVQTTAGFGINTVGGDAFFLYSNGALVFTDTYFSTITGAQNGLRAQNIGTGQLSILSTGAIIAKNGEGLHADTAATSTALTISTNTVTGSTHGIVVTNNGSGRLAITANGTTTAQNGIGIWANNSANSTDLSIAAVDVSAVDDGINAFNSGSGQLSISSTGTITAVNDKGIQAENSVNGTSLYISSYSVYGGTHGIVGINSGSGNLSIQVNGKTTAGTGIGIWADNRATGSELNIFAGAVTAVDDGINATNSGSGDLTILASGHIVATGDYGIYAINNGSGAANITIGSGSIVEGHTSALSLDSSSGQAVSVSIYGQARNLSGLTGNSAITITGDPVSLNLMESSTVTGEVSLTSSDDTLRLFGALNGSVLMNDGDDIFIRHGGSTLSGSVNGGAGTDTLAFNDMGAIDSSSSSSTYLSFENLSIIGGTTRLYGDWDFSSGTTTIQNGNLAVNGNLTTAQLNISSLGTLGGTGVITSDIVNQGTIAPGNSIGTLTVNGNVTFQPGSAYLVEISGQHTDLLKVNGLVAINNSSLEVELARALYQSGQRWTVLKASDGIDGSFSSLATNFNSYTVTLRPVTYDDSVVIVVERTPYRTFGITSNQQALGANLDAILPSANGAMKSVLISMDFDMTPAMLSSTLSQLSPEIYTVFPRAAIETTQVYSNILHQYNQEQRATNHFTLDEDTKSLWNVWGKLIGSSYNSDSTDQNSGYDLDGTGALFGLDRTFSSYFRSGLILGYSSNDFNFQDSSDGGSISSKTIGLYTNISLEGFYLDALVDYTDMDNDASRYITTPVLRGYNRDSFNSSVISGSLTGGYDLKTGDLLIGPIASLEYFYIDQDGIVESSEIGLAQHVESFDSEIFKSRLGIQLGGLLSGGERVHLIPRGEISWLHQFTDDTTKLTANFVDYPTATFTTTGTSSASDQLLLSIGLTTNYSTALSLYADYTYTGSDDQDSHLLSCGLSWLF